MAHSFDKDYWERHWDQAEGPAAEVSAASAPNPHLGREAAGLAPGTALDAGCGTGADAVWLAGRGWQVTAADISAAALGQAAERAAGAPSAERITWVEADLTTWTPADRFDLVTTSYAHPAMPQLAFYQRISRWVGPGGTLLIVGHLPEPSATDHGPLHEHAHGHVHGPIDADVLGRRPPAEATVTVSDITGLLDPAVWHIESAEQGTRTVTGLEGRPLPLHDAIVRATRRA